MTECAIPFIIQIALNHYLSGEDPATMGMTVMEVPWRADAIQIPIRGPLKWTPEDQDILNPGFEVCQIQMRKIRIGPAERFIRAGWSLENRVLIIQRPSDDG